MFVCPLITGKPKEATDIVRYREQLLHFRKFIVRSTTNPPPQQFLWVPMTNIINRLYIQTTEIHKGHVENQLSSHNSPFDCVLIDTHFPKQGKNFFMLS